MALMLLKKIGVLFLLFSASLLSTSLADRRYKAVSKLAEDMDGNPAAYEEVSSASSSSEKEDSSWSSSTDAVVHERVPKVSTNDYGKYDPAPALVRPPFKLIPN